MSYIGEAAHAALKRLAEAKLALLHAEKEYKLDVTRGTTINRDVARLVKDRRQDLYEREVAKLATAQCRQAAEN